MQMNVCYFPECMELHSLRSFFWITRSPLPTQFASYLSTPNCYNCGWRFPVLPLYSVMLKGIWFLFLGSSIASFSVHHITTSMYIWQTMPKSYLQCFPCHIWRKQFWNFQHTQTSMGFALVPDLPLQDGNSGNYRGTLWRSCQSLLNCWGESLSHGLLSTQYSNHCLLKDKVVVNRWTLKTN